MEQSLRPWTAGIFEKLAESLEQDDARRKLEARGWRLIADVTERDVLLEGLTARYGAQEAYPVLRRDDSDDILLVARPWPSQPQLQPALEVHDYAEPGWERNGMWPNFRDWVAEKLAAG
jgi:hypothetical protein